LTFKDVEAQNASADPTPTATAPSQGYAHLGRGGAGNWYNPSDLVQKGTFSGAGTFTEGTAPATASPKPSQSRQMMGGRGGAGNFHGGADDADRERLEAERAAEAQQKLQESIKADVEKGLAPPQKAYMGK
jgi:hypothetical protein